MVRSAVIHPGKRAGSPACQPFRLQRKMTFAKVVSLCCCVAAFGVVVAACGVLWPPFPPLSLTFRPLERHPPFALPPCLCLYACVPAGTRAGGLAGRLARMPARKQACRPFRLQRKRTFSKVVSLCRYVAAFGVLCPTFPPLFLLLEWHRLFGFVTIPMPACRQAQGQASGQAGEQVGGQECLPTCGYIVCK